MKKTSHDDRLNTFSLCHSAALSLVFLLVLTLKISDRKPIVRFSSGIYNKDCEFSKVHPVHTP